MLTVILYLMGPPINTTGGRFTTVTGVSTSMFYFVNRTNGSWSDPSFTIADCSPKDTSVDTFPTSLSLHYYVDFLYCDSILHSHIIFSGP